MNVGDDLLSFMRRQELAFLTTLENGPRVVERDQFGNVGENSTALSCLSDGYAARMRSHPRCGQDDDPPFVYMLTDKGRARLVELREDPTTPLQSGDGA